MISTKIKCFEKFVPEKSNFTQFSRTHQKPQSRCTLILLCDNHSSERNKDLKIRAVASVPTTANVYSVYVRQKKDASAQIFSLDYGDRMRVFDSKGGLRSTRKWSSKVRCIAVADVVGEGKDALVGGVGKKVLVVDHR